MILRNFLFLDNQSLNDYLAALEGYVTSGQAEQTISGTERVDGDATIENKTEKRQGIVISDAAKFQQLYKFLEREQEITYIDTADASTASSLRRNQIIELQGTIELPKSFSMLKDVGKR